LGLDDDDDLTRAFSKGTVQDYFDQALDKFKKMDEALYVVSRCLFSLQVLILACFTQ
jgi:hypothetical protein